MGFASKSKLANMLEVDVDDVMEATRNKEECAGFPVWEWVERGQDGEIYGFEVPQEVMQDLETRRANPSSLLGMFIN